MKKLLTLALSTLVGLSALTACGSAGTASTAAVKAEDAKSEDTKAADAGAASTESAAGLDVKGKSFKIAIDQAFAPFSIQQDDGSYTGIDVDLIQAVAELEGFTVELQPMDFSAIIPALVSGTIDGGMGSMSITDERKQTVDFSDSYYDSGLALVTKADSDIAKLEDLKGKTLAVKEGTQGALWAEDNKADYGFEISTLQDSASTAMAVRNGQADGLLEDFPVISYQIKIGEQEGLKVAVESVNTPGGIGFSVNKGMNQDLLAAFNDGLKKLKADGSYDKILKNYEG